MQRKQVYCKVDGEFMNEMSLLPYAHLQYGENVGIHWEQKPVFSAGAYRHASLN